MRTMLCLLLLWTAALPASELVKADGEVLRGQVLSRQGGQVRFRGQDGKERLFYLDELKSLDGERLGPAPAAPAGAPEALPLSGSALPRFMDQTWLCLLALGPGWSAYPPSLEAALKPWTHELGLGLDVFGFYWPVGMRRAAVGFVVNGTADAYSRSGAVLQLNHYLYGASLLGSLRGELGDGPYARLDLGAARVVATDSSSSFSQGSPWGTGAALSLGWLFGDNPEWRLSLAGVYSPRFIDGDWYHTGSVELGLLW